MRRKGKVLRAVKGEGAPVHLHEAMDEFEEARIEAAKHTVWSTGCQSWYLDDRGIPFAWPFPFSRFREEMAAPKLDDYLAV